MENVWGELENLKKHFEAGHISEEELWDSARHAITCRMRILRPNGGSRRFSWLEKKHVKRGEPDSLLKGSGLVNGRRGDDV